MEDILEEKTKKNESKHEIVDDRLETTMDPINNSTHNGWKSLWQNRRKILAAAVMVLGLYLLLIGLFELLSDMDILSESGERFQEIKDDNVGLKIIEIISKSLIWLAGIMSLWLISIELIAVLRDKPFLVTTRIHLILIAILLVCELLLLLTKSDVLFSLFVGLLILGFVMETCLCIYEVIIHVIKPIKKLRKDDYSSKLKRKIITRASFYPFSYIIGLAVSTFFLLKVIFLIIDPLFAKVDDYGEVYYDYGPGGIGNIGMLILFCILPIFLILSTFSMNIFHNEIRKRQISQPKNSTTEQ